jgi:hypothetical protein
MNQNWARIEEIYKSFANISNPAEKAKLTDEITELEGENQILQEQNWVEYDFMWSLDRADEEFRNRLDEAKTEKANTILEVNAGKITNL